MTLSKRQKILPIAYAALTALFVAVLGGTMTDTGPWYQSLIYALIVIAFIKAWDAATDKKTREWLIGLFCLNAALNIFWSIFFFRVQRPDWAFYENVLLCLSVLGLIIYTWKIARPASYLLFPYLIWVSFAAYLNLTVVKLNQPF